MQQYREHKIIHLWTIVGSVALLIACGALPTQRTTPTGAAPTLVSATLPPDVAPTPFVCEGTVIEQSFENGFMFWVGRSAEEKCQMEHAFAPGSGEIWVAIFDESRQHGQWLIFVDDWNEQSDPASDPTLTPPANTTQPVRGFGKVWREGLTDEQRQQLGWATGIELPFSTEYRYEGSGFVNADGEFVARPGRHLIRGLASDSFSFDETSQTFDYTPPQ